MTTPTLAEILSVVSAEYMIPTDVLLTPEKRTLPVTRARHVAQYLACTVGYMSKGQIAEEFKQRDHSAVGYALTKISKLVLTDEAVRDRVGRLKRGLIK